MTEAIYQHTESITQYRISDAADIDLQQPGAARIESMDVEVIDSVADKGLFHKNKAARHKSRLAAKVKALGAAA